MPKLGSLASGLSALTGCVTVARTRLKPARAVFTKVGLKTWVSSRLYICLSVKFWVSDSTSESGMVRGALS